MIGREVTDKAGASGKVVSKTADRIVIDFGGERKEFVYPLAFERFLSSPDEELMDIIRRDLAAKREADAREEEEKSARIAQEKAVREVSGMKKAKGPHFERVNVAIKCNYCDGGANAYRIGYDGICSDTVMHYNVEQTTRKIWCSDPDCACRKFLERRDGVRTRADLEECMEDGGYVCYESAMLRDWAVGPGLTKDGRPKHFRDVEPMSLMALTTVEPYADEDSRFVFAVYLVGEIYEGSRDDPELFMADPQWKMTLTAGEARKILFWNYHYNKEAKDKTCARWDSNLNRRLEPEQCVQILQDIAEAKKDSRDKAYADSFLEHFCRINGLDLEDVPPRNGLLIRYPRE